MLLPLDWPLAELLTRGRPCHGVSQGRKAPGVLLFHELADTTPWQRLFDACFKAVYLPRTRAQTSLAIHPWR